jgi:hypothetical protein
VSELAKFRIKLDTRVDDFDEGGLSGTFFLSKLTQMASELDEIINKIHPPRIIPVNKPAQPTVAPIPVAVTPMTPAVTPKVAIAPSSLTTAKKVVSSSSTSSASFQSPATIHPSRLRLVSHDASSSKPAVVNVSAPEAERKRERVTVDEDDMDMDEGSDDMEWESTGDAQAVSASTEPVAAPAVAPKKKKRKKKAVPLGGHMQSLVNKWNAVKSENRKEEDQAAQDLEAKLNPVMAQKRLQENVTQWKKDIIESGFADDNPNFLPVENSWRSKVARNKAKRGL